MSSAWTVRQLDPLALRQIARFARTYSATGIFDGHGSRRFASKPSASECGNSRVSLALVNEPTAAVVRPDEPGVRIRTPGSELRGIHGKWALRRKVGFEFELQV